MKIALTLIAGLLVSIQSLACSCNFSGGFIKVASESPLVVIGTVDQTSDYSMTVSITDFLKGTASEDIVIIGDRGDQCLESIFQFKVDRNYAFALSEQDGKYYLSNCGEYFVTISDGQVHGMLNKEFMDFSKGLWPQYNGTTMALEEFKKQVELNKGYPHPCKSVSYYEPNDALEKAYKEGMAGQDQFDYYRVNGAIVSNNLKLTEYYLNMYNLDTAEAFNKLAFTAISNGNIDIVKLFIERGLPVNISIPYRSTLLGESVIYPDLVKYLIEQGADVNGKNDKGKTPIMSGASRGCLTSINLLLENGADPEIKNNDAMDAIQYATKYNHKNKKEVIHLLKSN